MPNFWKEAAKIVEPLNKMLKQEEKTTKPTSLKADNVMKNAAKSTNSNIGQAHRK